MSYELEALGAAVVYLIGAPQNVFLPNGLAERINCRNFGANTH